MKSETKSKNNDKENPKSKKKTKRRYRNDRSKKWQQSASESSEDEEIVSEVSTDEEKRSRKKQRKRRASTDSSGSRSPSPEKRKKSKTKKARHKDSSSSDSDGDDDDERKSRLSKKKKRRTDKSSSKSPVRIKKSPVRKRKRSKTPQKDRKRSKSPRERKRSKSPRERKRSRSPKERKRSRSPKDRKRSRSPRKRSKSPRKRSKSPRKRSKSPRKRSKSPRKRSKSPRKRSKSPRKRSKSPRKRSKSPRKRSKSPRKSPAHEQKRIEDPTTEQKRDPDIAENSKHSKSPTKEIKQNKSATKEMNVLSEGTSKEKSHGESPIEKKPDRSKAEESKSAKKDRSKSPVQRNKSDVKPKVETKPEVNKKSNESENYHRQKETLKTSIDSQKDKKNYREKQKIDNTKKDDKNRSKPENSPDDKEELDTIEEEMRKRKERIEAWRNARKKPGSKPKNEGAKKEEKKDQKKWSLEDDGDSDEDTHKENTVKKKPITNGKKVPVVKKRVKEEQSEDEDLDPLDAFMKTIDKEVNKGLGRKDNNKPSKSKTVTVVRTVVKKTEEVIVKPEVMEQNQDAMEYSSEEEAPDDVTASDFTEATRKKKELTVADHTKIYYAPFKRDFYIEVPELAKMTADEVKLYRDALGDIQVHGKNIPKPLKAWSQAGLSSKVMNVLKKCQYEKPTPIQAQAIPVIMSGRDMIGIAKTGSGKTLAFLLPMLRHVLDQPMLEEDDGPLVIIMTPTRELALQIFRESKKFCKQLNLSAACIYGGSGISEQIAELKRGAEIIVCTPGRMIDMLAANGGKVTNCRRCTYLVLDEADRMFDMGFEPQVMRIIGNIRPDRQTVLFSATFPRQMEAVARKVLTKPIQIQVGGRSVVCSDIEQNAMVIEADNKFFKLLELLGVYQETGSVLTFVEKQETADSLFKDLLKKGYPCLSLHGGMDQFDRDSTIADFKNGVTKLMVSTSVAARGLDVKNLILVINYDCPNHYEDYVHRVGRTGRAGNKGTAFTFITPEQGRNAGDLVKAFELAEKDPPADVLALWNEFKESMAKEGKKVKLNSGFTGKGFKFNAEEAAQVNDAKKMRKFTLGLQDSDDEAEAAENAMDKIEADLEKAFSNKPKVALAPEVVEAQKNKAAELSVDKDKLKAASDMAAMLNKKLSSGQVIDRNAAATAQIMQGGALESLSGVGLAKQFADKLNAKLNYKAAVPETPEPEKKTAVRYEEEIDINDFPQQARWRITSKEIIEQVRELSEAGVTVRGVYIPPNKKVNEEEDEKRLHLYIESLSERSIQIAKAEIKRLLKEELIRAESNTYRPSQTGRYKVV